MALGGLAQRYPPSECSGIGWNDMVPKRGVADTRLLQQVWWQHVVIRDENLSRDAHIAPGGDAQCWLPKGLLRVEALMASLLASQGSAKGGGIDGLIAGLSSIAPCTAPTT